MTSVSVAWPVAALERLAQLAQAGRRHVALQRELRDDGAHAHRAHRAAAQPGQLDAPCPRRVPRRSRRHLPHPEPRRASGAAAGSSGSCPRARETRSMRFGLKSGSHTARSTTRRSTCRHSRSAALRARRGRARPRAASAAATVWRSQKPLMLGLASESGTNESQPSRPSSSSDGRRVDLLPLRETRLDAVARVLHERGLDAVRERLHARVEAELEQHDLNVLADGLLHGVVGDDDVDPARPPCPTRRPAAGARDVGPRPGRRAAERPRAVGRVAGEAGREHLAGRRGELRAAEELHDLVAVDREVDGLPRLELVERLDVDVERDVPVGRQLVVVQLRREAAERAPAAGRAGARRRPSRPARARPRVTSASTPSPKRCTIRST